MQEVRKERRAYERYTIDTAEVVYLEGRNIKILKRYTHPLPLKDISQSGIRFEVGQYLGPGSMMDLIISAPSKQKIEIRGNVIWITKNNSDNRYEVGVQFLPFGESRFYNSFKAKQQLEELIKPYLN